MRVAVLSGAPPTTLLLVEAPTLKVDGIKEEIRRQWHIPVALQRLVCCGNVLEDSDALPDMCVEGAESLWLVRCRCTEGEEASIPDAASDDFVTIPPKILSSLFPSTAAEPSDLQDTEEDAIDIFRRFCLSVAADAQTAPLPWRPTETERAALASAAASLGSQTAFFTPYACALLCDESNAGWAHLRLSCLDEHAFVVHSGTAGRSHASRVGAARVLPVGAVPIGRLETFFNRSKELCTDARHESRGKDSRRIGSKGKRGHQKTPGFIFSVLADVLRTLEMDDAAWLSAAKEHPTLPRAPDAAP
ncbi:hypothetical protein T484DRAFT_1812280 [Baffinella frigidus]|nr:hypothetical protein T484DRAFT_1812280 [Cryptophyta sp. CCMP2293]